MLELELSIPPEGALVKLSIWARLWYNAEKTKGDSEMNITVYLGANEGNDPALKTAVQALGRWIGESGNALVYGGSKSGLMGCSSPGT